MMVPTFNDVLAHGNMEYSIIPSPPESLSVEAIDHCVHGAADEVGDVVEPLLEESDRRFHLYGPHLQDEHEPEIVARTAYHINDGINNSRIARIAFFQNHEYGVNLGPARGGTICNPHRLSVLIGESRNRQVARTYVAALLHQFQIMLDDQPIALSAHNRLFHQEQALFSQNSDVSRDVVARKAHVQKKLQEVEQDAASADQAGQVLATATRVNAQLAGFQEQNAELREALDRMTVAAGNAREDVNAAVDDVARILNQQQRRPQRPVPPRGARPEPERVREARNPRQVREEVNAQNGQPVEAEGRVPNNEHGTEAAGSEGAVDGAPFAGIVNLESILAKFRSIVPPRR